MGTIPQTAIEGRLFPRQKETKRREKKFLKLGEGIRKFVADFVASLGTLSRSLVKKYRTTWGR